MSNKKKLEQITLLLDTVIPEEDLLYIQNLLQEVITSLSEESPCITEQDTG